MNFACIRIELHRQNRFIIRYCRIYFADVPGGKLPAFASLAAIKDSSAEDLPENLFVFMPPTQLQRRADEKIPGHHYCGHFLAYELWRQWPFWRRLVLNLLIV